MRGLRALVLLALCSGAAALAQKPATPAPPRPIVVDPNEFRCLLANLERVPSEPRGVFVNIRDCQREGVRVIRNLIAPPVQADTRGNEFILFVRPDQLSCMKRNRKNPARILERMADGRYRLKLEPCGR